MSDISTLNNYQLLEYGAWALSFIFGLWMLLDMMRTNITYSEDLSSRRGKVKSKMRS